MFIAEVLHPTLQQQSFPSDFPFSVDDALSNETAEKGIKKVSMSPNCELVSNFFSQLLALFE
jgi:hypothetical protein